VKSDRSSFRGAAIGSPPPRVDQDEDELDEEPDDAVPEPDFEPDDAAFADEDFEAEDLDAEGFEVDDDFDAGADEVDDVDRVVDEVCDCVTWATSFFAPSRTVSPTSPARLNAKSLTVCTPSWTFGWFQTSSAAFRICS
jgi:hypothetical protein